MRTKVIRRLKRGKLIQPESQIKHATSRDIGMLHPYLPVKFFGAKISVNGGLDFSKPMSETIIKSPRANVISVHWILVDNHDISNVAEFVLESKHQEVNGALKIFAQGAL